MTSEQQERLKEFDEQLTELEKGFEAFVYDVALDEGNHHPLWEVWQPISTAQARLSRFVMETCK